MNTTWMDRVRRLPLFRVWIVSVAACVAVAVWRDGDWKLWLVVGSIVTLIGTALEVVCAVRRRP